VHCAGCHSCADADGRGIVAAEPSAPNLHGFGSREWIAGFLDPGRIADRDHFAETAFREGDMAQHLRGLFADAGEEGGSALREKLETVAALLAAEAGREPAGSPAAIRGRELLAGELGCVDCHKFHDQGELGSAPDLTGYASAEWLTDLISAPNHVRFYSDRNDRMPSFAADASHPELNLLSPQELSMLVQWLAPSTGASHVGERPMQSPATPVPQVARSQSPAAESPIAPQP
jgi:hypothetical protein